MVLIRLDNPSSDLQSIFKINTSGWTASEREIIDAGINGNADWKLLGYWAGYQSLTVVEGFEIGRQKLRTIKGKVIFLMFRQLQTGDTYWYYADFDRPQLALFGLSNQKDMLPFTSFMFDAPALRQLNEKYATMEAEIKKLKKELEDATDAEEDAKDAEKYWKVIGIVCVSTGGLALVFGVVFLGRCKWRGSTMMTDEEQYIPSDGQMYAVNVVASGKLKNNRPPILVDECEKFGLNEIYDVTAGEGGDLVQIARSLETAGDERKLSEELLNIQPIYKDEEGRDSSKLHGTSPGCTKGGDVLDYEQSGNRVVDEMRK